MEKVKKRIKKTCETCALLKHGLCKKPGEKCDKWVNYKYTCRRCEYAKSCIILGKNCPGCRNFCVSFSKAATKNPASMFPDAEEFEALLREKRLRKEKKKQAGLEDKAARKGKGKTKDVGKKELLDPNDVPIKSPLVKVARPKIILDTTLQDKDRKDWSALDMIEEIISRNYDPEAFALVDERCLPKSDNIIRFLLEPEFLNQPLYPRQLQIVLDFFAAYCPYCSHTEWLRNKVEVDTPPEEILDRVTLYKNGICPKCGKTRYDAIKAGIHINYASLVLAVGQRSGKTSLLWMSAPAIIHEYLQIPNPAKFMRQLEVTEFHATFVGVTSDECYKNVWSPMDNIFTWSPWYRTYHQFLDEEGKRIGTELYKHLDTFVAYSHKGIYASFSNGDFRKLRGKTRIISSIDEGAFLTGDKIMMNAWQAYDALNNSLSTIQTAVESILPRFPWAPSAYGLYTSSTRSKQDFIMGMYKRSKRVSNIYGKKMATWEFNPNMPRNCEFIRTKYMEDPVAAERDYASNPPFASDPFIRRASQIIPIITKRPNTLTIDKIKITKDSLGGKALYPTIKCIPHNFPCCVSIDGGWKKNSFAIAITHLIPHPTDKDDALIATSGLLEIQPMDGIPISHNKVYEHVIKPIMETYNVVLFVTDNWQGVDFQSRVFTDFGIDATQYSLKYPDFESLRTRIHSETWKIPKLDGELKDILDMDKDMQELIFRKPISHLMIQLLVSKDTGRQITKNQDAGEDFTDDLLRAAALGVAIVESEEYGPMFSGEGEYEKATFNGVIGACAGVSASGAGKSSGGNIVPGIGLSVSFSR